MAIRHTKRPKRLWRIVVPALLLVTAVVLAAARLLPGLFSDQFRLSPNAKIQADETYRLECWVGKPNLPDLTPWKQGVDQAVAEFTAVYPNVSVNITYLAEDEAAPRLNQALQAGTPPDLFFSADDSQGYYGDLQLPLSRFVDKQERTAWPDSFWRQLTSGDTVYSLPVAGYPQVYMVNSQLFQRTGLELSQLDQNTWSWSGLIAAAEQVTEGKVHGYVPTTTGEALLRSLAASIGKPAPFLDSGELAWTREDLVLLAEVFGRLNQSEAVPSQGINMDANCLDLFLTQKAAIIGPVNPQLAVWLWGAAVDRGIAPRLVPVPCLTDQQLADVRVAGISLFRQSAYQGHGHTRAAAELAQALVPRLGELLSSLTGALPATAVTEAAGFLPFDQESFQTYSGILRIPDIPYAYGPIGGLSATHWRLAITPAWEKLAQGEYTAEQFAEAVLSELSMATIAGP